MKARPGSGRRLRTVLFGGWSQPPWRGRRRVVRLPVVVAEHDAGRVLRLEVRVLRFQRRDEAVLDGPAALYDDHGMRESFGEALKWAKTHPRFRSRSVMCWRLLEDGDGPTARKVGGKSAGGAMALALAYLHGLTPDARRPYDRRTVLSAAVTPDGDLAEVTEFRRKVGAVAERGFTLLVSPGNRADAQAEAEQRTAGLRTEEATDVPACLARMRVHPSRHPYWMAPLIVVTVLGAVAFHAVGEAHEERDAKRLRELSSIVERDVRSEPGRAAVAALAAWRIAPAKAAGRDALLRVAAVDPRLRGVASSTRPAGAVAVSADGRRLAVGGDEHRVRVQEPGGGAYRAARRGGAGISALVFTPDGRSLISADEAGHFVRWDVSGPVPRPTQEGFSRGPVRRLAISPDGGRLAVLQAGRGVSIWPLTAGRADGAGLLRGDAVPLPVSEPTDVAFVDDDSVAVTSARRGEAEVAVHAAATGRRERMLRPGNRTVFEGSHALAMARLADGPRVLAVGRKVLRGGSATGYGRVTVWDTGHWKVVREVAERSGVIRLAAGRDGDRLVVGSASGRRSEAPSALQVLDLSTGRRLGPELGGPGMTFREEPQLDAAGERLVALTDTRHPTDWSVRPPPAVHEGWITALLADPRDAGQVITTGMDGMVRVVAVPALRIVETNDLTRYGPIISSTVTPDGRTIVTGHIDGRVVVTDRARRQTVRVLGRRVPAGVARVLAVAVDPSSGRMAAGDLEGTVRIWSLREGRLLRTIRPTGGDAARTLLFPPRTDDLIIGYDHDRAMTVPLSGGSPREVTVPAGLVAVAPLSASTLLTGGNTGELHVTDYHLRRTGRQPSARLTLNVMNVAVSPDRRTWLATDRAGTAHVIDAGSRAEIATINAVEPGGSVMSTELVHAAAFTDGGRRAVLGSAGGRLIALDLSPRQLVRRVCSLLPAGARNDPDITVPREAQMGRREALTACT